MWEMPTPTHAILFENNQMGNRDLEYRLIFLKDGVVYDFESEKPLLQYRGDKIIKSCKLNFL